MGEVELLQGSHELIIHSLFIIYGDAATDELSQQIAIDVATHWNEPNATVQIKKDWYRGLLLTMAKTSRFLFAASERK